MRHGFGHLRHAEGALDILATSFAVCRLAFDLMEVPDKVRQACQALMPHLATSPLPAPTRGSKSRFPSGCTGAACPLYPSTISRPSTADSQAIVEALWRKGTRHFLCEGKWDAHLERFAELPAWSIVFHIDRSDPRW